MKTHFTNSELPHKWWHESDTIGYGKGSNFYFDGDTIYSYGRHFPIARKVKDKRGNITAVLFTTRGYSTTTSCHVSRVWDAIPRGGVKIFHVYDPSVTGDYGHISNIKQIWNKINNALPKAARAIKNVEYKYNAIIGSINDIREYIKFFKVKGVPIEIKRALRPEYTAALEKARDELVAKRLAAENTPAKIAAREAAARKRALELQLAIANALAEYPERLRKFREHESDTGFQLCLYAHTPDDIDLIKAEIPGLFQDHLRLSLDDERIETSRGARVSVKQARLLWEFIQRVIKSGVDWHTNGEKFVIDNYPIRTITAAGDIEVGCHNIPYTEILYIAGVLGWVETEANVASEILSDPDATSEPSLGEIVSLNNRSDENHVPER